MSQMSLHRIIAEIKAIETKLTMLPNVAFVYQALNADEATHAEHVTKSQSSYDSTVAAITNLATLKSARNKANSLTTVTIGGKQMTIDEALAQKAALVHKQTLIRSLQTQFTNGQRALDASQQQIEARVAQQLASMFTGTRKASDEEVKVIRSSVEGAQKIKLLHAENLKANLEALTKEVADFQTEVDYVLSEANALTVVEVPMI